MDQEAGPAAAAAPPDKHTLTEQLRRARLNGDEVILVGMVPVAAAFVGLALEDSETWGYLLRYVKARS